MDEDAFNMSLRKFLKKLGVTSQREIEAAVRAQLAAARCRGTRCSTWCHGVRRGLPDDIVTTGASR
jgi:hypothetical protein